MITQAAVKEALAKVIDPALGHDIISYRMVRSAEVQGDDALIRIELPTHAYPVGQRRELIVKIEQAVKALGAKRVTVVPEDARRAGGPGVGDGELADHPGLAPRAARDQRRILRRQGRGRGVARADGPPPADPVPR